MRHHIAKILEAVRKAKLTDERSRARVIRQLTTINPSGAVFCSKEYAQAVADVMEHELRGYCDPFKDGEASGPEERRKALEQVLVDCKYNAEEYGEGIVALTNLIENFHMFLGKLADQHNLVLLHTIVAAHPELVMPKHFPHLLDDVQIHTLTIAFAGHEERGGTRALPLAEMKAALN